jgi:hypothetical protein
LGDGPGKAGSKVSEHTARQVAYHKTAQAKNEVDRHRGDEGRGAGRRFYGACCGCRLGRVLRHHIIAQISEVSHRVPYASGVRPMVSSGVGEVQARRGLLSL